MIFQKLKISISNAGRDLNTGAM